MYKYLYVPEREDLPKFIYIHIPKTGGTTFRKMVIDRLYGVKHFRENLDRYNINYSSWHRDYYNEIIDYTPRYRRKNRLFQFNVISGHFRASKYLFLDYPIITWLRNPTDRLISHYYNWLNKYNNIKHYDDVNKLVWYEYFKNGMDIVEFSKAFGNHMSFFFNIDFDKFKFIGILEKYYKSLKLFGKLFNLKIIEYNVVLNSLKYPIVSNDIRKQIAKNQKRDFELYNNAFGKLRHEI